MGNEIFIPMFYLVLLTIGVFLLATLIRLKEIYLDKILNKDGVDGEEFRHPPFETGSVTLKNTQRNLSNLLEFPILFYVVCISIFVTDKVDDYFITLAYWFFYLRLIHSIYHIFFNNLIIKGGYPFRSFIWVPATAVILWMWIRFMTML